MSQGQDPSQKNNGKTMIGTLAPNIPRSRPPISGRHPIIVPAGGVAAAAPPPERPASAAPGADAVPSSVEPVGSAPSVSVAAASGSSSSTITARVRPATAPPPATVAARPRPSTVPPPATVAARPRSASVAPAPVPQASSAGASGPVLLSSDAPTIGPTGMTAPANLAASASAADPASAPVAPAAASSPAQPPPSGVRTAPAGPPAGTALGDDPDLFVGQELGGYLIKRKLAEGGMGVVYEGEHAKIGRRGAIKVLKIEFCRSEDVLLRFQQEAQAVNKIRHENIVDIYDFGRDPYGRTFFVMEYLEGEPLSARIRRGALAWPDAFPILEQTLRALKAAHDHGFVHRDLKPDNIWLKYIDGRVQVKLLDFGIAKLVGAESPKEKLTQTGSVIGTPHYMSPEQINGSRDIDHRTDIYAMGVITYELFAGVTPFVGDTLQAIMTGHLFKEPPRLADIPKDLGVPPPIAEIVDRMLFKDATGRYASVTDVLADLHDVNANRWPEKAATLSQTHPPRVTVTQPSASSFLPVAPAAARRANRQRAAVIGGLAAVGLAIGGVALWKRSQPDPPAPPAVVTSGGTVTPPPPPPPPAPPAEKPLDHEAIRKEAQLTLRASLREAEPAVRVQGVGALARTKDRPSVPALTDLTEKDPDQLVRGHAGEALGALGASDAAALLGKLEAAAPAPLKVWYASALARLGDKAARKRLLDYSRSADLAVAYKAGVTLAEVSAPGDRKAIDAVKRLVRYEAQLNELEPYAGALLLSRLAALRDAGARKILYTLLEDKSEGVQLAAAEGLARLGDDAGKQVLASVLKNDASPNRLVAAVAQISLGEYAGQDLITAKLGDKDPGVRRLAARALGDIGDRASLRPLLGAAGDKDWTVRIAASAALVAIVGIDPLVLAQASVDWTKSALGSSDWAVRKAAAGVLADIPEEAAVPLLAQAILDQDPKVRLEAARSAGKMKITDPATKVAAATKVADAVKQESDPAVKEQQVRALGEIGSPAVRDTLAQISEEPGRVGVLAAGSLIAVGDASGKAKLDAAVAAPQTELRLAAVQAASAAKNAIVVPTLKMGIEDRVFDVRFTAAEGLAGFGAEKAVAVPVLTAALGSKDSGVLGRAMAALLKLGEPVKDKARSPEEMLDSTDAKLRLAAVPVVRALPASEGVPLLRRLVADSDQEVRRAGVEAIEAVAAKDKDQAIRLYKPLVSDDDPVVRSKAAGQLARLVPPPPPVTVAVAVAATPTPSLPSGPAIDPKVQAAATAATAAATELAATTKALEATTAELKAKMAEATQDEETLARVAALATELGEAAGKLAEIAAKVEAAAKAAADAAGASPTPETAKLVADAQGLVQGAKDAASAGRAKATEGAMKAKRHIDEWTGDPGMLISGADASIATGDLADAKQKLERAARLIAKRRVKIPGLDYSYGQLYDKTAARTQDPAAKLKLLQQAVESYERFAKSGSGPRAQRATARAKELAEDAKELGAP